MFGTRPEIVKLAGVVRLLGPAARTVHTGQHYSPALSAAFLDDLGLGTPAVQLDVGGASRGRQIGEATAALDAHLTDDPPSAVVVQGDTNTGLAGALAANAGGFPLLHVEAGLRSFDRAMPEEHNRVLVDHLADVCCAPTETSRANLLAEGVPDERVLVTGNTVVEAVLELLPDPSDRPDLLARWGLRARGFVLATFHRPENVDDPHTLATILRALADLPLPVLLPMHPRTAARAARFGLGTVAGGLRLCEPLGYAEFLGLAAECALLVSDSGGVQEEASVLKRPVIVVRRSTERPEVQGTFATLVPPGPGICELAADWIDGLAALHARLEHEPCPYGDGTASARTVAAIRELAAS